MSIGRRTKEERERLGWSQAELARRIGDRVRQAHIGQLESGETRQPRYLTALARVLGVTVEWLETGREPKYLKGGMQETLIQPSAGGATVKGVRTTQGDESAVHSSRREEMSPAERKLIRALVDEHGLAIVVGEAAEAAKKTSERLERPFKGRGS